MIKSIFIFRRDFRVIDNTGWNKSIIDSDIVYPIFIFTPEQITNNPYKSNNSIQFFIESLLELGKTINITYCYGNYIDVLTDIIKTNNISAIYTNTDYTPYAVKRDTNINKLAQTLEINFHASHDITLYEPGTIRNQNDLIYQKYTPFYNKCLHIAVRKPKTHIFNKIANAITKYSITKDTIKTFYTINNLINIHGGRKNGLAILNSLEKFKKYDNTHNLLNINTTNLSAYLKFGCISIRECYYKFVKLSGLILLRQLIWREFYYHLGYGFIDRFGQSLKPKYDKIKWKNNMVLFNKWKNAQTGFPIIDACMTQLNTTGYMHNRGRLIVSSFLIKNLHIDWRLGEKYFAQKLIDYDVLVNQGNWQWVSGSGADSQPYFRVFNPWRQSHKFDKDALYIKKWLPELKAIPSKHLHNWDEWYQNYTVIYHKPIVNYNKSKQITLKLYRSIY